MPRPPQILATSGGFQPRPNTRLSDRSALMELAISMADVRLAKVCGIFTAIGDDPAGIARWYGAMGGYGDVDLTHLALYDMPSYPDYRQHLLRQDVIWVCGGSTANLLALWRVHGLPPILAECWQAGVVLTGVSAGSLCWHTGGTTDSFGLELQVIDDGLGLVPYSNCPHYDAEQQRRPLYHRLVGDGVLPAGYATDNGAGVRYEGTTMVEAVTEYDGAGCYWVERGPDGTATETALPARVLPAGPR